MGVDALHFQFWKISLKYKFSFKQNVDGVEYCDAVVDADSPEEALEQIKERNFTMYIVQRNELERGKIYDVEALGAIN